MAIVGAVSGVASNGTTPVTPAYPTTIKVGDYLLLHVVNKYPANGPTTPSGWTLLAQASGGAGAAGDGSGNVYSTLYGKIADAADVTAAGAGTLLSVTVTGANSTSAKMYFYAHSTLNATWDVAVAVGAQSSAATAWSVAADAQFTLARGDGVMTFAAVNDDGFTASAHNLTAAGVTLAATTTERADGSISTGDDIGLVVTNSYIETAPTTAVTVTYVSTLTAARAGSVVFLRIREVGGVDGPYGWQIPACGFDFRARGEEPVRHIWPCYQLSPTSFNLDVGWVHSGGEQRLNAGGDAATLGLYSQALPGWSRLVTGGVDGDQITWRRTVTTSTPGANSVAMTAIVRIPAVPTATGPLLAMASDGATLRLDLRNDGRLALTCQGVTTVGIVNYADNLDHWVCFYYDRTNSVVACRTDRELIEGVYDASITSSGNFGVGFVQATQVDTPGFFIIWGCIDTGTGAERNWKTFLQNMGVNVVQEIDTMKLSTACRNRRLDAIEVEAGTSPRLKVRTGAAPANCAAADTGTVLADVTLPSDWANDAASGQKTLLGTWQDLSADAAGTAEHWRLYKSDGTTCVMQGSASSVLAGTGEMLLDNAVLAAGQAFTVTAWTVTDGNA